MGCCFSNATASPEFGYSLLNGQNGNYNSQSHGSVPASDRSVSARSVPRDRNPQIQKLINIPEANLVMNKLSKFLSTRPTSEVLFEKNILHEDPRLPLEPMVITAIIQKLHSMGAIKEEGIFRISGNFHIIREIYHSFLERRPNFSDAGPHDVAGALKYYLRELPNPIIPFHKYEIFIKTQESDSDDFEGQISKTKKAIQSLPEDNQCSLKSLLEFLKTVTNYSSINLMTSDNLGIVFGPGLLRKPALDISASSTENSVIAFCIEYYDVIYEVEKASNKQMMEELKKQHLSWKKSSSTRLSDVLASSRPMSGISRDPSFSSLSTLPSLTSSLTSTTTATTTTTTTTTIDSRESALEEVPVLPAPSQEIQKDARETSLSQSELHTQSKNEQQVHLKEDNILDPLSVVQNQLPQIEREIDIAVANGDAKGNGLSRSHLDEVLARSEIHSEHVEENELTRASEDSNSIVPSEDEPEELLRAHLQTKVLQDSASEADLIRQEEIETLNQLHQLESIELQLEKELELINLDSDSDSDSDSQPTLDHSTLSSLAHEPEVDENSIVAVESSSPTINEDSQN